MSTENWPNLSDESRASLYAMVKAAGVDPDGKWLSEAATTAIRRLLAVRAAAEQALAALVGSHAADDSVQGRARSALRAALGYGEEAARAD